MQDKVSHQRSHLEVADRATVLIRCEFAARQMMRLVARGAEQESHAATPETSAMRMSSLGSRCELGVILLLLFFEIHFSVTHAAFAESALRGGNIAAARESEETI